MKTLFFPLLAAMTLIGVSSCSDDKNDNSPTQPTVKMVLTEMRGGYVGGEDDEKSLQAKYDSKGRITEITYGSGTQKKYSYTDSKITVTTGYGNADYDITDGKIVKESDGDEYFYDSANQLVKITGRDYANNITWNNGNIVSATEKDGRDTYKHAYTYYPESNVGNLNDFLNVAYSTVFPSGGEFALSVSGYFGRATRNLCKSISYDGQLDRTFYYEDYNEYGYPQTLKIVDYDDDVQIYSLTWKKL